MFSSFYGFRRCFLYGFRRGRKTFVMVSVAGFLVDSAAAGGSNILECIERFLVVCVSRTGFRRWFLLGFQSWLENVFVLWFPSLVVCYGFRRWFCYGFRLLQDRGCLSDGNRNKTYQDVSVTN